MAYTFEKKVFDNTYTVNSQPFFAEPLEEISIQPDDVRAYQLPAIEDGESDPAWLD
jgi:hypothetical protein